MRTEILSAAFGWRRGRHCAEIALTVLASGHRVDPVQALHFQCLAMYHKVVARRLDLHQLIRSFFEARRFGGKDVFGPMGMIHARPISSVGNG